MGGPPKALFRQSTVCVPGGTWGGSPIHFPADSSVWHLPSPSGAHWPCSCKARGVDHADGCPPQQTGGGQSQKGKGPLESGCRTACSLPFKQRLSPAGLNLATGFSAGEGGWSHVTLGQQRGPNSVPQHLLMGNVHSTPLHPPPLQTLNP